MNIHEVTIRYSTGRTVLKLDKLFPQTKEWWRKFLKKTVAMDYDHEEDILNAIIDYLRNERIPKLPEDFKRLDKDILAAYERYVAVVYDEWAKEIYLREWMSLKRRKKSWAKWCAKFDMNLQLLEEWRNERFGGKACEQY